MKTFNEYLDSVNESSESNESSPIKITEYTSVEGVVDDKNLELVKKLLADYDFFTMMIDDLSTMRRKEANNKEIENKLKEYGVTKIIKLTPNAEYESLKRREIKV